MVGKTQEEVAALTENLYSNYQRLSAQPSPSPSPSPTPNAGAPGVNTPPDTQLFYSNPQEYQRQLIAYQQGQFNAQLQALAGPVLANQAETAKALSKAEYANVWKRWEPEIELELASIPVQNRTKQMYDTAARIVKGNHSDEIAEERAQQLMSQAGSGTERGVNVPSNGTPAFDKLDEIYDGPHPFFRYAREQNVTKEMIREHCRAMKISVEEYVKNATLGTVVATNAGFTRSSD